MKKRYLPPNEAMFHQWAERQNKLWDLDWLTTGIEEQANAVLREHGRDSWREVKDGDPEPLRLAGNALSFLELMREELADGNTENAIVRAIKCGACAGALPGAERLQLKLSRAKKDIRKRVLELYQKGLSRGQIANRLNDDGFQKKSGKPYDANDVKGYLRRINTR